MKRKKAAVILAAVIILAAGALLAIKYNINKTQNVINLSDRQKEEDFSFLCRTLDDSWPFWTDTGLTEQKKNEIYEKYRRQAARSDTDIEFFKTVDSFLSEFGGRGHLGRLDGWMYGVYIFALDSGEKIISREEEKNISRQKRVLNSPACRNLYSMLDKSHPGFRSLAGLKEEYKDTETATGTSFPEIESEIFGEYAYLKISSFDLSCYDRDKEILEKFFADIKDVPNLIIDIRENSGGSDLYWQDLLVIPNAKTDLSFERYFLLKDSDEIKNYADTLGVAVYGTDSLPQPLAEKYADSFELFTVDKSDFRQAADPYPGKIYLLTSNKVYSAAENFAMMCKNTSFATLVGENTGGDGGMADPLLTALPNSGLIIRFSAFYGLNRDGSGNEATGTRPDIVINDGQDALQLCKDIISGS